MDKEKRSRPFDKIVIAITVLSFAATILIHSRLPDQIPYHWGVGGHVKTIDRRFAFITALTPAVIYYMVKYRSKKTRPDALALVIALFIVAIHWAILFIAMG